MKKKIIILLSVFCLSLILFHYPIDVKADYNWIENNSFEDGISGSLYYDMIPNGFQNISDGWDYTESTPYESINTFDSYATNMSSTDGYTMQHFTFTDLPDNVVTIDNVSFVFNGYSSDGASGVEFYAYNFSTSNWDTINDYYTLSAVPTNYTISITFITGISEYNIENFILKITRQNGGGTVYIDAVTLKVGYSSSGTGQTDITAETEPWFTYWYVDYTEDYLGITDSESYDGDYSCYITRMNQDRTAMLNVWQDVNWLLTDNVTALTLYAKTDSTENVKIRYYAMYSDGVSAIATSTESLNSTTGWTYIEFPLFYINTNKLIIRIGFDIATGDYGDYTYLDLITLNATTQPATEGRFSFYTLPETTFINNRHIGASVLVDYVFYGYWYNGTGDLADSGTFSVTSERGTESGTISYGQFNFDIVARGESEQYETETLTITLNIDGQGIFIIRILVSWNYIPTIPADATPAPTDSGDYETANNLIDWIVMFIVIFLPSLLFAGGIYENNQQPDSMHISPIFGLIAGLVLSIGISVYTSLVDLWILILMIVAVVVLIVGMVVNH